MTGWFRPGKVSGVNGGEGGENRHCRAFHLSHFTRCELFGLSVSSGEVGVVEMKHALAIVLTGISTLLPSSTVLAHRDILIYMPTFNINGWRVRCSGLETEKTYCIAEHREVEPYLYLQFYPDRIDIAASLGCTQFRYNPAVTVRRGEKSMSELIREVDDRLLDPLKACASDPMHTQFRNELDDIEALLIRTTAVSRPKN